MGLTTNGRRRLFRAVAILLLATAGAPAHAATDDPVKSIMDVATALWSGNPAEELDYFDKNHIGLFSKDFIATYHAAEKFPVFDEGSTPFDYDVITSSQDGCQLKDLVIAPGAEVAGTTDVKVTFKLMSCYDGPDKESLSEVHFKVITEDGKRVIADVDRINDGKPNSLLSEMKEIIKSGQEAPKDQQEPPQQ